MGGFDLDKVREQTLPLTIKYGDQAVHIRYYFGEKAKELEQRLAQSQADAIADARADAYASQMGIEGGGADDEIEDIETDRGRRELCETLCLVVASWDIRADLGRLLEDVEALEEKRGIEISDDSREERRKRYPVGGRDLVPIEPLWFDAFPLPTAFHIKMSNEIGQDLAVGGRGGKGR